MVNQASSDTSTSLAFVNKDWEYLVVMQENDKVVVEDVWGIIKEIGVKFNGDNANMFSVLSKVGRGMRKSKIMGE